MDWFLYDSGLRHERVNIRNEIWQRSLMRASLKPGNIYLFKFNNINTWKRCELCPELTTKTPERRQ